MAHKRLFAVVAKCVYAYKNDFTFTVSYNLFMIYTPLLALHGTVVQECFICILKYDGNNTIRSNFR